MALIAFLLLYVTVAVAADYPGFGFPPGVNVWCGKAYEATNASFNPGGGLDAPTPSAAPLLDLKIRPRMSFYTSQDGTGSFIVDAGISYTHGQPFQGTSNTSGSTSDTLTIAVLSLDTLVASSTVMVNSTDNEVEFSLSAFAPQFEPYDVSMTASLGNQSIATNTQLYVLPARTDTGSAVKLDSLYGGLMVQDPANGSWSPFFPYSFYVSWSGFAQQGVDQANVFKDQGYNMIHIIASYPDPTFNYTYVNAFLSRCDEIGLWVMYDMRGTYQNTSAVADQISWLAPHPSLLLWYTADEPDGNTDPLNATRLSYDHIRSIDPYHPISLALNCFNFHYAAYSSGADIVMPDVYPVAINATYSLVYHTPVNATYGDCGCDDCQGSFADISTRLDRLATYQQAWLGRPPKTLWAVPQAFGASEYWPRVPTPDEMVVMDLLNVNHNAKGLVAWIYPTDPAIEDVRSRLAKVLTQPVFARFVLGARTTALPTSVSSSGTAGGEGGAGGNKLDVAAWYLPDAGQMLVSVVYWDYVATAADEEASITLTLTLPESSMNKVDLDPTAVDSVLWGTAWTVSEEEEEEEEEGGKLVKTGGLDALEVDLFIVDVKEKGKEKGNTNTNAASNLLRKGKGKGKALQRPL